MRPSPSIHSLRSPRIGGLILLALLGGLAPCVLAAPFSQAQQSATDQGDATASSVSPRGLFQRAIAHQRGGDHTNAIRAYRNLLATGRFAPEVFYNLGMSHLETENWGYALVNLRRAQLFLSGDPDLKEALRQWHQSAPTEAVEQSHWTWLLFGKLPFVQWRHIALIGLWITGLSLTWALARHRLRRTGTRLLLAGGLVCLVIGTAGCAIWWWHVQPNRPIIVQSSTSARYAPLPTGEPAFNLPSGTTVTVEEKRPKWLKIRHDQQQGWIPEDHSAPILPLSRLVSAKRRD